MRSLPGVADATLSSTAIGSTRRWGMLAASTAAQAAAAMMTNGPAFLIPSLRTQRGLSLAEAGLVVAAPAIGVVLGLVAWGAVSDRWGERRALLSGLGLTSIAGVLAVASPGATTLGAALLLGGIFAASTNAASGRVVVGWFPSGRRGLAMGIRQMAQPAGLGAAALTMTVAADTHGVSAAMWIPTLAAATSAGMVALVILDPPRPPLAKGGTPNPYRQNGFLARIHGISMLLVVPQFVVWTFAFVWLTEERGWSPGGAGAMVAFTQLMAALGRIGAGQLSDLVSSRMRPLRWIAVAAGATMAMLAFTDAAGLAMAVPVIAVATVVTVADNGLSFTAVAERAGPFWSGRALGIQNTAQSLTGAVVPPVGGLLIATIGFPSLFALSAVFPILAAALVPVRDEIPVE